MRALTTTTAALALACVALLATLRLRKRGKTVSSSEARIYAEGCLRVASLASFGRHAGLLTALELVAVKPGEVNAKVRVGPSLQNTMHSLHGGAVALLLDELTSAAIMSTRAFPGVSVAMTINYLAGCGPGDIIQVVARVTKMGRILAHTECEFFGADGTLMARGTHVKYVASPWWWSLLVLRARPWLHSLLLGRMLKGTTMPSIGPARASPTPECTPQATDTEKAAYYRVLGSEKSQLTHFDNAFAACGLRAEGPCADNRFLVSATHASNTYHTLHGAATAGLFDIMGSAAIARHPLASGGSCGVATNLEVQYGVAGKGEVAFTAEVLRLGARLAAVKVVARDSRGRLVAQGTVTKYGKLKAPLPQ